jgi:hypothetical protein
MGVCKTGRGSGEGCSGSTLGSRHVSRRGREGGREIYIGECRGELRTCAGKAGGNVFIGGHARSSLEMLEGGEGELPTWVDTDVIVFTHTTLFVLPPGQSR